MNQALVPGLQVLKATRLRRRRELPVAGEILVSVGANVRAEQSVARAFLAGELHIIRIAEQLGIQAFEALEGLKVKQGDQVQEGQILCTHVGLFGLFKLQLEAPVAGTIEFVNEKSGHVGIRMSSTPIEINSYLTGKVVELEPTLSVTIEAQAGYVQGIFGVGGERQGKLKVIADPDSRIDTGNVPQDCQGAVLVGGKLPSGDALRCAAERGASGFITGSIDDRALKSYLGYDLGMALTGDEDVSMTVIVTEGFGDISMSSRVFQVFQEFEGCAASINGATQVRAGAIRPEIVLFGEQAASSQEIVSGSGMGGLAVGRKIRIIRVPYFGEFATVVDLPHQMEKLPTGAYARVLHAKLDNGEVVVVPRANVEVV